ncbi:MAG: hypothetical protein SOI64_01095 [Bifidobacterium mongoliense]
MNRQVVARHLKSGDMRLSEFIKTAHALGADPVKVLADAVTEEKKKAPAATGAE